MNNPEELLKEEPTSDHDSIDGVAGLKEPESASGPEPESTSGPEPEPEGLPATYVYRDFANVRPSELERSNVLCHSKAQPQQMVDKKAPAKLALMLSDPDLQDVLTWMPHGRSWKVVDKHKFMERCANQYFGHSKFESFGRLVNGWGFRRIKSGPDKGSYYHELFLRGMPHLHERMKRIPAGKHKVPVEDEYECPNFYELAKTSPLPELKAASESVSVAAMPQSAQNNALALQMIMSLSSNNEAQNQRHASLAQQPFVMGDSSGGLITAARGSSNFCVYPPALSHQQLLDRIKLLANTQQPSSSISLASNANQERVVTSQGIDSLLMPQQLRQFLSQCSQQHQSNGNTLRLNVNQAEYSNVQNHSSDLQDQVLKILLQQHCQGQNNTSMQQGGNALHGVADTLHALQSTSQFARNGHDAGCGTNMLQANNNSALLRNILLQQARTAENATRVISQALANDGGASSLSMNDKAHLATSIFSSSNSRRQVANNDISPTQMNGFTRPIGILSRSLVGSRNPDANASISAPSQQSMFNQFLTLQTNPVQPSMGSGMLTTARQINSGLVDRSSNENNLQGVATSPRKPPRNADTDAHDSQGQQVSLELQRAIIQLINDHRNNARG